VVGPAVAAPASRWVCRAFIERHVNKDRFGH